MLGLADSHKKQKNWIIFFRWLCRWMSNIPFEKFRFHVSSRSKFKSTKYQSWEEKLSPTRHQSWNFLYFGARYWNGDFYRNRGGGVRKTFIRNMLLLINFEHRLRIRVKREVNVWPAISSGNWRWTSLKISFFSLSSLIEQIGSIKCSIDCELCTRLTLNPTSECTTLHAFHLQRTICAWCCLHFMRHDHRKSTTPIDWLNG